MELEKKNLQNHCSPSLQYQLYRFGLSTFIYVFITLLLCTFASSPLWDSRGSSCLWDVSRLTNSAVMVRQGQCFLVSLTLMALAFCVVFRALDKLSGVTSRQISLSSEEKPSIWYSSKKLAWRGKYTLKRFVCGRHDHDKHLQDFRWLVASGEQDTYLGELTPHADPPVGHFPRQNEEQIVWSQSQGAALG